MSRQQTPDILSELQTSTRYIDSEQENNKAIKQAKTNFGLATPESQDVKPESNKTIKILKNKEIKQDDNKKIIEMKEKATFNLSLCTLETLEDAWIKLKRQFKGEQRITKTAIVEMALDICLGEFKERNDESLLYKKLADLQNTDKPDYNSPT